MEKVCRTTHLWKVVKDEGPVVYRFCLRCGTRDAFLRNQDYADRIDRAWLEERSAFPASISNINSKVKV